MSSSDSQLDVIFPLPFTQPTPAGAPSRLPGITDESSKAVVRILKDNHIKWHIFFNDRGFHNHAAHHLLAVYKLGASAELLQEVYKTHVSYMRPAFKSPEPVSSKTFHKHLGDENFYNAYLNYFTTVLLDKGGPATIEEYIFSPRANIEEPEPGHPPMKMLNRFLAGLLHPLIHTSYGTEFNLLGILAEGLAQTAVHSASAIALVPPNVFKYIGAASTDVFNAAISRITALFPSLSIEKLPAGTSRKPSVHVFTVLSRILRNPEYGPAAIGLPPPDGSDETAFGRVLDRRGDAIVELAEAWVVDGTDQTEVENKLEELAWLTVLIYGVGGWGSAARKVPGTKPGAINADFFLVHLVTSSLFIPSIVSVLSPTSISILLRTYFANCLAWYIARGRPVLPIQQFYACVSATPAEPNAKPSPAKGTLTPGVPSPNPWLPIVQSTLVHPDDHLCKLQRALVHYAELYGDRRAGYFSTLAGETGLEGAEFLDGTLFIRVAGLTAAKLGWMREGQEAGEWDRHGFFE